MSSSGEKNKDFSDGMNDGEQIAKWVMLTKLKKMKKENAPNSSGGRVIKELEEFIGKPWKGYACVVDESQGEQL